MRREYEEYREPLGKRVGRFFALVLIIIFIVTAVLTVSQLGAAEPQSRGIILGTGMTIVILVAGVLLGALPVTAIAFLVIRMMLNRQAEERERSAQQHAPTMPVYPTQPPVIMIAPPQYQQQPSMPAELLSTGRRQFHVVGNDEWEDN